MNIFNELNNMLLQGASTKPPSLRGSPRQPPSLRGAPRRGNLPNLTQNQTDYFAAPATHPSGRYAWQNGYPAVWCHGRSSLAKTRLLGAPFNDAYYLMDNCMKEKINEFI